MANTPQVHKLQPAPLSEGGRKAIECAAGAVRSGDEDHGGVAGYFMVYLNSDNTYSASWKIPENFPGSTVLFSAVLKQLIDRELIAAVVADEALDASGRIFE